MTNRLQGKVALITGAGSGIGKAAAELFARESAAVAIVDLNEEAAAATAVEIERSGGQAVSVVGNVAVKADIGRAVEEAANALGGIHVLYNNAGVNSTGSVVDATEEDWDRCFDVNVKGTFLTTQAAIPFLSVDGGAVVNQASVAALVGVQGFAAYCAAKGAVVALTRSMAVDLASRGIRVNAICPGTVYTPLMEPLMRTRGDGDLEAGLAKTALKYPIGRIGTPDEIAQMALWLASDEASFATGGIFTVDGGMTSQ